MFKLNRWIQTNRYRVLSGALCLFVFCLYAQNTNPQPVGSDKGKVQKVILEHANKLSFDKLVTGDAQVLRGDVRFRQEGMYMFCDSAYFYEANNSLDAFGNVRMEQGDTLFVFSDFLRYNGTSRLAELRYNVKMENRDVTLLTDSLNYDRMVNVGYYFEGGVLTDPENELTSYYGQYSPDTKMARFNDNVKLINEKYTLYSDTLDYDTNTRIADIIGPSTIISDSNTIYSSRGWYNTLADVATLYDRSSVVSGERVLTADTLFYNRNTGFGEGFTNVEVTDTVKKMTLYGQYGYYNEISEHAFVTDSSWLMDYSRPDTLYLAADTLMTYPDSTFRIMEAIKRVRMFSEQSQAVAGKALFTSRDTLLKMMDDP
ncbi:MAG: OstA-like protein, partial [Bacteroidales bacterium]